VGVSSLQLSAPGLQLSVIYVDFVENQIPQLDFRDATFPHPSPVAYLLMALVQIRLYFGYGM
jgi:hypothetical protein